ncbi:MAG TPA: methylmalonyl-CoA mutase family protein, partial [Methyloceanibacter sp.]|nr:methylmalonyl-CoA mutase family protein [Methyloceanibacter sp.]
MVELTLARNFPPADEAAWKALVEEALKGAPFASLRSESYDGIAIEPLYARAQGAQRIAGRAAGMKWSVVQRIDLPDAKAANTQALADLSNGANGLNLVFEGAVGDYGYALPATAAAISQALDNVYLDAGIAAELDFGPPSRQAAKLMAEHVRAKELKPSALDIRFCFDPLGARAMRGAFPMPWPELAPVVTGLIGDLAAEGFKGPFAVAVVEREAGEQRILREREVHDHRLLEEVALAQSLELLHTLEQEEELRGKRVAPHVPVE